MCMSMGNVAIDVSTTHYVPDLFHSGAQKLFRLLGVPRIVYPHVVFWGVLSL
jgi:hypothetical protein